jgi:hypothetical protein
MSISEIFKYFVYIISLIVPLLISLAIVAFMWGIVKFIAHADDEKAIVEGKQFMVWGLVGIFVLISFWGIVGYLQESLGLNVDTFLDPLSMQPSTIPD